MWTMLTMWTKLLFQIKMKKSRQNERKLKLYCSNDNKVL